MPDAVVTYTGPPEGAVPCARAIADADGIELTGSSRTSEEGAEVAVLELTISGSEDDIRAAVVSVSRTLPPGARLSVLA